MDYSKLKIISNVLYIIACALLIADLYFKSSDESTLGISPWLFLMFAAFFQIWIDSKNKKKSGD